MLLLLIGEISPFFFYLTHHNRACHSECSEESARTCGFFAALRMTFLVLILLRLINWHYTLSSVRMPQKACAARRLGGWAASPRHRRRDRRAHWHGPGEAYPDRADERICRCSSQAGCAARACDHRALRHAPRRRAWRPRAGHRRWYAAWCLRV